MNKELEKAIAQILYTLKYASKSRKQLPREVFKIDGEDVGKPDCMAYNTIKQAFSDKDKRIKELIKDTRNIRGGIK
jgi:hypothetical protein